MDRTVPENPARDVAEATRAAIVTWVREAIENTRVSQRRDSTVPPGAYPFILAALDNLENAIVLELLS